MEKERRYVLPVNTVIKEQDSNIVKSRFDNSWEILIGEAFAPEKKLDEINWQRHFIEAFIKNENATAQITCLIDYERIREEYGS